MRLLRDFVDNSIANYSAGLVCSLGSTRFSIASDQEPVIHNAAHYLLPTTELRTASQWEITLDVVSLAVFEEATREYGAFSVAKVKPGFTYHRETREDIELFRSREGFERSPHLIVKRGKRLAVLAPQLDEIVARIPVRLVREVGLRESQNAGGCFIHAGAVVKSFGGILVVGASGAGKTTTLLRLLRDVDAQFVANDRGVVSANPDGRVAFHAWPLGIRVGQGTHLSYPELCFAMAGLHRSENELIQDKLARLAAHKWGSRVKYEYTPLELCHRFGREATMACEINAMVIPNLSLNGKSPEYRPIRSSDVATRVLKNEITEPSDAEYGRGWLGVRTIADEEAAASKERVLGRLLNLPSYELVGDPRAGMPSLQTPALASGERGFD